MLIIIAVLLTSLLLFLEAVTTISQALAIILSGGALVCVIVALAQTQGWTTRTRA